MAHPPPIAQEVRGLTAGYGGPPAIRDVNFDLRHGALTGLIGPNGAGKSTLVKAARIFIAPGR